MDQFLKVRIVSPKQMLFEGQATSVSSANSAGKFDILPSHANFISFIENQPIVIRDLNKQPKTFEFPFAIIYNQNNIVTIYTNISLDLAI